MYRDPEWEWWFVAAAFFLLGTFWGWGAAHSLVLRDAPFYLTLGAGGCALVLVSVRMLKRPARSSAPIR